MSPPPPAVPGQSPGGGPGGKAPRKLLEFKHFTALKISSPCHIFINMKTCSDFGKGLFRICQSSWKGKASVSLVKAKIFMDFACALSNEKRFRI